MKELAPPNVNLKRLYEQETKAHEPILIIISPGADPSQDLEEIAKETIGLDKYHQVGKLALILNTLMIFYSFSRLFPILSC